MTCCQRLTYALSQPKLKTPHYNVNGLNLFTSRITIFIFSVAVVIFIFYQLFYFIPVFACLIDPNLYVSSEYIVTPLSEMVDVG